MTYRVGDQIRFVEFKSYKTSTSLNTTDSAEQLMSYPSQIGSMQWRSGILNIFNQSIIEEVYSAKNKKLIAISSLTLIFSTNSYQVLDIEKGINKIKWANDISDIGIWWRGHQYRFQQPFNRYQFKPTYKGLTLILGVGRMT